VAGRLKWRRKIRLEATVLRRREEQLGGLKSAKLSKWAGGAICQTDLDSVAELGLWVGSGKHGEEGAHTHHRLVTTVWPAGLFWGWAKRGAGKRGKKWG